MNKKIIKALKDPYYACELVLNKLGPYVSDENFIKWKYYLNFHHHLNLQDPQSFNEKLQWLKLYDRKPEYTQMVDKYEAKLYVSSIIGNSFIIPTYGVYDHFDEIDIDELPNQFVMKCTHNSGGLFICKDKTLFDFAKAKRQMEKWLSKNPYWGNREYPYKNVKPRIIIEKYMEQEDGESLRDYKVLCFNGKAKLIELHRFRNTDKQTQDFYDIEWHKTSISQGGVFANASKDVFPKPRNLEQMIQLSEQLTSNMIHCRVDWYSISNQLYFGELTFYDGSGLERFDNIDYDYLLGSWIKLIKNGD